MSSNDNAPSTSIKPIDKPSIHRITSGQVVIDLQTAVKELLENSLDADATNIEVRFKQSGLSSVEVIDNGSGIAQEDHDSIALKHHTSKLSTYADLTALRSFGFRGEALSSLCALCQSVQVTTSTSSPKGTCLDFEHSGKVKSRKTVARQRGTTVVLKGLFQPLPVRRKELERNIKREFAKALNLLTAYALLPCAVEPGIRLTVTNQSEKGTKTQQIITQGIPSMRQSVTALWGPKALDNLADLELEIEVEKDRGNRKVGPQSVPPSDEQTFKVRIHGLISKFSVASGRTGTDRQFFYVNGRPCTLNKIQKVFNEVYRTFNATQSPFVVADFIIPPDTCDVNVSPDKRTIFLHNEANLITALKAALEERFDPVRSTFDVANLQPKMVQTFLVQPLPSANSRFKVTNNNARMLQRTPSPDPDLGTDEDEDVTATSVQKSGPSRIAITSSSTPGSKSAHIPLFMPDTEQDTNSNDDADSQGSLELRSDPHHSRVAPSRKFSSQPHGQSSDDEVVVNTSGASWNQSTRRAAQDNGILRKRTAESESDRDVEPPSKKRKSDVAALAPSPSASAVTVSMTKKAGSGWDAAPSGTPPASSQIRRGTMSMRTFLTGFASTSTQGCTDSLPTEDVPMNNERGSESDMARGRLPDDADIDDSPPLDTYTDEREADDSGQAENNVDKRLNHPNSMSIEDDYQYDMDSDDANNSSLLDSVQKSLTSNTPSSPAKPVVRPEIVRGTGGNHVTLKFDLEMIKRNYQKLSSLHAKEKSVTARDNVDDIEDAGLHNTEDEVKAAEVLSRIIKKTDFAEMEVVGQFNLGFIITRRRKPLIDDSVMDDLFIVDQHAADEKYNFETLQQTTIIQSQKLFRPRPLELTASDELVATDNIDILRKNGFEVDMDEAAPSGSRLMLSAQPVSKSTVFDVKDLEELIHLMRDRPTGQMVRCSKARAMFAMRACRKSVMIGMPLTRHQMLSVVRHMGTMDQPWNCPHGRPTMRHLVDLGGMARRKPEVDWGKLTGS